MLSFQIHDTVLYGPDGVCEITDIVRKEVLRETRTFYELHPKFRPGAVIYLPVDNENTSRKLRPVLTREEVLSAIRNLPAEESIWIERESERKDSYGRIVKSGDCRQLLRLIKTLRERQDSLKQRGKKLHASDDTLLREAEKLLFEEFAFVLGLDREEVPAFIRRELGQ